jgi:hypothetical protein
MAAAQALAHYCRGSGSHGEPAASSSSEGMLCTSLPSRPKPTWLAQ